MFENIINGFSEAAIERMFLEILKGFSSDDLNLAVRGNDSLLLLVARHNPRLLKTAAGLAMGFGNQGHLLTTSNVMGWIKNKRRDLWLPISMSSEKKVWLERQIEDFRSFLF